MTHCPWPQLSLESSPSLIPKKSKKDRITRIWPWPDALLHTFLAQSVTVLLLFVTANHYCCTLRYSLWAEWCSVSHWRAPLWKMLGEQKAFHTLSCVVASSRSGNENVALTRSPGCCSALPTLCLPGLLEGQCLACGWMRSSLHPQLQLHHFSGQCHSALSKTDFKYKEEI